MCAALQGIGVPPHPVDNKQMEARKLLQSLFIMGVQPEALLLPRRPDQGKCKLCRLDHLQALIDVLMERCNGDLSQHKEVGLALPALTGRRSCRPSGMWTTQ